MKKFQKLKLLSYNGSPLNVLGTVSLSCVPSGCDKQVIKFAIVETNSDPILGLTTEEQLNLIKRLQNCRSEQEIVGNKYKGNFQGLGKMPFK